MEIQVGKRVAEIELISKEGNLVRLSLDGKEFEVDVTMLREGVYSILRDGRSYNAELSHSEDRKTYMVNTVTSTQKVQIVDAKAKYLRMKRGGDDRQDDKIVSPMPGKVVSIPVEVGTELKAGDTVVVIEAMKMQNNYKVATDCVVKEILVNEGDAVQSDQVMITLTLKETE